MKNVYDINGNPLTHIANRLDDHTWSILGDSISTDGAYVNKQYWDFISERHEDITTYVYGQHGYRASDLVGMYTSAYYSDILTAFVGINDFGGNVPIGTISDNTTNTFYGALNLLCDGILNTFSKSLVIFITPLGNNNSPYISYNDKNALNLTIYDYAEAMKNVCAKHKIPVIDACSNSLLNPYSTNTRSEYFVDGLHLNVKGHEVLSYMIENEMLSHYIPNVAG